MKTPIWLLSGFLGAENHWGEFPEKLAHFSGSMPEIIPWHRHCEGAKSIEEAASFLAQFAYSSGERPILVGYSMGGRVALQAAISSPGAFSAVVALSAHPGFQEQSDKEARMKEDQQWKELLLSDLRAFWSKWNAREALHDTPKPQLPNFNPAELKTWADHLTHLGTGAQTFFPQQMTEGLKLPVLSITGEQDKKFCELQKCLAPFLRTHILPKAGHRLPLESASELAQVVAEFLKHSRDPL